LNAKGAVYAYLEFFEETGLPKLPLFISGTLIDIAGRTLSGQTVEAFYISMMHANPFCIGLNCALGADLMFPFIKRLCKISTTYVHAYPNAGLPNQMGGYDETPESFAKNLTAFAEYGINMVGGCCGTNANFIRSLKEAVKDYPRREIPKHKPVTMISNQSEFIFRDDLNFVNVGERCNISGSLKFKKLIVDERYYGGQDTAASSDASEKQKKKEYAVDVAKEQIDNGAQILDINLDEGLINGVTAMTKFVRLL